MSSRIKAVLFDFDGTLSDSLIPIHGIINAMRAERGAPARNEADLRSAMSMTGEELVRDCLAEAAREGQEDLSEFRRRYVLVEPDPSHLYPGAAVMLEELRRGGFRCAICSNKPHDLLIRFVEGTGLAPYFDVVIGADVTRKGKPHPDVVWHTLEKLDVSADEAILVGDSEADAEAAQGAGLPFILVTFGYAAGALDAIPHQARVDSLCDLPALLVSQ